MKIKIIKIIIGTAVLTALIYYILSNQHLFSVIKNVKPIAFLWLLFLGFLSIFFIALSFKLNMQLFRVQLKFKEWVGLTAINTMYNYILPARSGFVARAYYLKKKYGFEYSSYLSYLSGAFLISFLVASFSASFLLILRFGLHKAFLSELFWLSGIVFLVSFFVSIFFWNFPNVKIKTGWNRLNQLIENLIRSLDCFKSGNKTLRALILSNLGQILILGLRLFFVFKSLNISVNLIDILIINSFIVFSMIFSITPGNIGIKEGIIVFLANMLGISMQEALLAATLDRVVSMIVTFSSGSIYSRVLLNDVTNKPGVKINFPKQSSGKQFPENP